MTTENSRADALPISRSLLLRIRKGLVQQVATLKAKYWQFEVPQAAEESLKLIERIDSILAASPVEQPARNETTAEFAARHLAAMNWRSTRPAPSPADERAAQMAHDLRCAGVAGTKAGDLLHDAAAMIEALARAASASEMK